MDSHSENKEEAFGLLLWRRKPATLTGIGLNPVGVDSGPLTQAVLSTPLLVNYIPSQLHPTAELACFSGKQGSL